VEHNKHEEKVTTIRTQHVVTLTAAEIEAALMMYVAAKTGIGEGIVRSREPAYFQARGVKLNGGQLCGPLEPAGSCVQLVFTTGDK
jgi:hypothetical protein